MPNELSLSFEALDVYSLAMYNNKIPLIDEILIKNDSEYNLKNLEVEVSSSPSFFATYSKKISDIFSERCIIISNIEPDFDVTKLMYTSKVTPTVITVKIKNSGDILVAESKNISLLPFDHIPPVSMYTELISSFVTPNQHEIEALTIDVEENLRKQNFVSVNRDTWDRGNRRTSEIILKAIYETVKGLKITINTAPAFSETSFCRVKLAENVMKTRNGNYLEIALLFCSITESLGFNSFLILTSDGIAVGVFYGTEHLVSCVSDDKRELVSLNNGKCKEFCVIDISSVVSGLNVSFDDSLLSAQKLVDKSSSPIVIDLAACRERGYIPFFNRIYENGSLLFEDNYHSDSDIKSAFNRLYSKNPIVFSEFIRENLLDKNSKDKLLCIDTERCLFLIGDSRFIISKLVINGGIRIRCLPINGLIADNDEVFEQLIALNGSINLSDMSDNVNSVHSKESFNVRTEAVISDSKLNAFTTCISLGSFHYLLNGEKIYSPLFYVNVDVDTVADGSIFIKNKESKIFVNSYAADVLTKKGVDKKIFFDFDNLFDSYDEVLRKVKNAIEETDIEYYDTVALITIDSDGQKLYEIASPEYFESSKLLSNIFFNKSFVINKNQDVDTNIDFPFLLDSSQKLAVSLALNNDCSVVRGAYGSGKSLVSASIAFSEISKGKKVLYFSDSKDNIDEFKRFASDCDFLHCVMDLDSENFDDDNFEFLNKAMSVSDSETTDTANKLFELIDEQNKYYENLHKVNDIGFSLFESASQYERYRSFPFAVSFTNDEISKLSRDDVVLWLDCVSAVSKAGADCKEPFSNPLALIQEKNFSYDFKSRVVISLNTHSELTKSFLAKQTQLAELLGIKASLLREKQTLSLIKLLHCIKNGVHLIHYGIFGRESIESDFSRIEALALKCDDIFELKEFVETNFMSDVTIVNCDFILSEWRNALTKFAFSRASSLNAVKNKLKIYCKDSKFLTNDNFVDTLAKLSRYKNSLNEAIDCSLLIYQITGVDVKSAIEANDKGVFDRLKDIVNTSREYLSLLQDIFDGETITSEVYMQQAGIFKHKDLLIEKLSLYFSDFENYYRIYTDSESQLAELLKINMQKVKNENNKIWYYYLTQLLQRMVENIDLLKSWCNWNIEKERAISLGLGNVISLYESEQLSSTDIKNAFLKGFFKSVTEYFLSKEYSFWNFASETQTEKTEEFYSLFEEFKSSLCNKLNYNYSKRLALYCDKCAITVDDAITVLKTNLSMQSSRSNDSNVVGLLQTVKPCMVCNTTRAITKFDNTFSFDTVIVDISVAKEYYDVFMLFPIANKVIIIDDVDAVCSERISDILVSYDVPESQLSYIYSSSYLSHIINQLLYNNKLSTIPLSDKKIRGINVIRQSGTFDSKKSRVNVVEASAVVDEIIRIRTEHPESEIAVYSITEQQCALIKLLYQKRSRTIVGDHKLSIQSLNNTKIGLNDYVILSTVISVDKKTNYSNVISKSIPELSFEAINALKYVILSAKSEFTVITSLSEKELDSFKTTEKEYCLFKKIMYKLLDDSILTFQDINLPVNENPIIREVSNHIEALGYRVDINYGIGKFKIDIAVRNKNDNKYLLGILFDESVYINCDDFVSREIVVSRLEDVGGWKIIRIHTVDWFENRAKQLDMVTSALNGDNFEGFFGINKE